MSQTPATGQRALDVPATPTTPLVDASLGQAPHVLTQAPLQTEKAPIDRLALVAAGSFELMQQYFVQVYRWQASDVREVSSWAAVEAEFAKYSSINELVVVSHSSASGVWISGDKDLTPDQFAERFRPLAPPITSLSFDGCMIGNDLTGLHAIATKMKISQVRGWTFWHYLDLWQIVPIGDPAAALDAFRPLATKAAPYLPKNVAGDTYSVAEQEPLFSSSTLKLAAEYFFETFDHLPSKFVDMITANKTDPAIHRTRASAEIYNVNSAAAQSSLEEALNSSRPLFARAVVTPWV